MCRDPGRAAVSCRARQGLADLRNLPREAHAFHRGIGAMNSREMAHGMFGGRGSGLISVTVYQVRRRRRSQRRSSPNRPNFSTVRVLLTIRRVSILEGPERHPADRNVWVRRLVKAAGRYARSPSGLRYEAASCALDPWLSPAAPSGRVQNGLGGDRSALFANALKPQAYDAVNFHKGKWFFNYA